MSLRSMSWKRGRPEASDWLLPQGGQLGAAGPALGPGSILLPLGLLSSSSPRTCLPPHSSLRSQILPPPHPGLCKGAPKDSHTAAFAPRVPGRKSMCFLSPISYRPPTIQLHCHGTNVSAPPCMDALGTERHRIYILSKKQKLGKLTELSRQERQGGKEAGEDEAPWGYSSPNPSASGCLTTHTQISP